MHAARERHGKVRRRQPSTHASDLCLSPLGLLNAILLRPPACGVAFSCRLARSRKRQSKVVPCVPNTNTNITPRSPRYYSRRKLSLHADGRLRAQVTMLFLGRTLKVTNGSNLLAQYSSALRSSASSLRCPRSACRSPIRVDMASTQGRRQLLRGGPFP
jgi:hypothetical protein